MNGNIPICRSCQNEMKPKFIKFKAEGHPATSIYYYNPFIKKLIYQYKGCYDYELNKAFISMFAREIRIRYLNYVVVPIPSYKKEDEERGFNHVIEIFKNLGLEMLEIIEKTEKHKQAKSSVNSRHQVYKFLALSAHPDLRKKKVLLVDDVYTTGSTIKSSINLIEKLNPKRIEVLVIAKTKPKQTPK